MSRQRTVVKVGTSTLTYENGKMNYRRVEALCKVLCDLHNSGEDILLVSSGAIGVGMGKTGLSRRPESTKKKQALAAIGQCELMFMYDKLFGEYNHNVAQILLTADVVETDHTRQNIANTIEELLEMDIIPIINENDTVAIDEIYGKNFGDNDMLSAIVSGIVEADRLIILTDIDGLYDRDPHQGDAKLLPVVHGVTEEIRAMAGGSVSGVGTGGMVTKLDAAEMVNRAGIPMVLANGADPEKLYAIAQGESIGTLFEVVK